MPLMIVGIILAKFLEILLLIFPGHNKDLFKKFMEQLTRADITENVSIFNYCTKLIAFSL